VGLAAVLALLLDLDLDQAVALLLDLDLAVALVLPLDLVLAADQAVALDPTVAIAALLPLDLDLDQAADLPLCTIITIKSNTWPCNHVTIIPSFVSIDSMFTKCAYQQIRLTAYRIQIGSMRHVYRKDQETRKNHCQNE